MRILSYKMWSYSLPLSLLLCTLVSLASAIPENEDDFDWINSNDTDSSGISQPRFTQVYIDNKIYTIFSEKVNWYTALERCGNNGQKLASIISLDENINLIDTLHYYGSYSSTSLRFMESV